MVGGYGDRNPVAQAVEDQRHRAERQLCATQGFQRITVQHCAKVRGLVAKPRHFGTAIAQEGDQSRGV